MLLHLAAPLSMLTRSERRYHKNNTEQFARPFRYRADPALASTSCGIGSNEECRRGHDRLADSRPRRGASHTRRGESDGRRRCNRFGRRPGRGRNRRRNPRRCARGGGQQADHRPGGRRGQRTLGYRLIAPAFLPESRHLPSLPLRGRVSLIDPRRDRPVFFYRFCRKDSNIYLRTIYIDK